MKKFIFFAILITGIVSAASAETVLADQLFFDGTINWNFYPSSIHSAWGGKISWMHYWVNWVNKEAKLNKLGVVGELGYFAESPGPAPWPGSDWLGEDKKARNIMAAGGVVFNNTGKVDGVFGIMEYAKLKVILHSFRSSYPPWTEPVIYPLNLDVGLKVKIFGIISIGLGMDLIGLRFPSPYLAGGIVIPIKSEKERKYKVWEGKITYEEFQGFTEKKLADYGDLYLKKSQFNDFDQFLEKLKEHNWTRARIKDWFSKERNLDNSGSEEAAKSLIDNPSVFCYRTGKDVHILVKE